MESHFFQTAVTQSVSAFIIRSRFPICCLLAFCRSCLHITPNPGFGRKKAVNRLRIEDAFGRIVSGARLRGFGSGW